MATTFQTSWFTRYMNKNGKQVCQKFDNSAVLRYFMRKRQVMCFVAGYQRSGVWCPIMLSYGIAGIAFTKKELDELKSHPKIRQAKTERFGIYTATATAFRHISPCQQLWRLLTSAVSHLIGPLSPGPGRSHGKPQDQNKMLTTTHNIFELYLFPATSTVSFWEYICFWQSLTHGKMV